jgi:hypothetical protein
MDENTLNDQRLKAAVKRVWSEDTAPPELRARVQQMLSTTTVPARSTTRWTGYAIAALLLLSASTVTWIPWNWGGDEPLPPSVLASMVQTHDRCCGARNHHLLRGVHGDDYAAIGRKLSGDLGVPVLSIPLAHWEFAGAGPCPVWGHESAHLLYRDGMQTLSVFSIPAKDFALGSDNERYAATLDTHRVAGFVHDGGLYCVVANSPDGQITAAEVSRIRDQLLSSFSADSYTAGPSALAYGGH